MEPIGRLGRLLYVSGYPLDAESGFAEHVREIAVHLARLGWQVTLVGPVNEKFEIPIQKELADRLSIVTVSSSQTDRVAAWALFRVVQRVVIKTKFDAVYMRPARKTILIPWWLKQQGIPLFVEVNTNTVGEARSFGQNKLSVILADVLERFQFRYALGAFCVTHELAAYAKERISDPTNVWVTGNGFRPETTELAIFDTDFRDSLGITNQQTVLVFLGRLGVWQGVDLVVEALTALPDVCLWVIGDGPERLRLEELIEELGVKERVFWFGYCHGRDLQVLLNSVDIAIGTLAMYRKQMYEAQSLKVRHYLGVGLPTIIGYKDTLIDTTVPGIFYAQTPQEIVARVREIQQNSNARNTEYRQHIRDFALQNLSWAAIARMTSEILMKWFQHT